MLNTGHLDAATHLAAMNAPRIIVNTVSCTGRENFFLPEVKDSRAVKFHPAADESLLYTGRDGGGGQGRGVPLRKKGYLSCPLT